MTAIQELWVPRRVPSLNEVLDQRGVTYGNGVRRFDGYAVMKKSWAQDVAVLCVKAKLKPVKRVRLHFTIVEPNRRKDPDNLVGVLGKLVTDGLVQAGVLPDDGWDEIESLAYEWCLGKAPGVLVRIEEVAS